MPELAEWDSFYVIVRSAAGALIGPQFVVITLIASRAPIHAGAAGAAFASPSILHFCAALFLAVLLRAPWQTIAIPSILWAVLGAGGVIYMVIVVRRTKKQTAYNPVFEDWLLHAALPLVAYAMLAASLFVTASHERDALFGVGAATLILLFTGIPTPGTTPLTTC